MQEIQYLTFKISEEVFGLGILHIKEIIEYESITHVPMMPDYIPGVINLRGHVVPVLDLNHRFYKKTSELNRKTCIIITEIHLEKESIDVGLLVDSVNEVVDIPDDSIEDAPNFGNKIRLDFIAGLGKLESQFVIILKLDKILNLEEFQQIHEKSTTMN